MREGKEDMRDNEYIVYKISTSLCTKVYIGQTSQFEQRIQQHTNAVNSDMKGKLYDDMRKYGLENFRIDKLESCRNKHHCDIVEAELIKEYDSYHNGYNETQGNNYDDNAYYRLLGYDFDTVLEKLKNMKYETYDMKDFDKVSRNIIYFIAQSHNIQELSNIGVRLRNEFLDRKFELFDYMKMQKDIENLYHNTCL